MRKQMESGVTPLYHGTRRGFDRGGLLLPGGEVGQDNHGLGRTGHVYVTPDLGLAKHYAEHANGKGRPRVVEVAPLGPVEVDDSTVGGDQQESYRVDCARVLRVAWRKP